jgi:hypothetical protein
MPSAIERVEPELAERFRKNSQDEAFLALLNGILAPHEDERYQDLPDRYPLLHIIGAPRSGTTLLSQLVASCLDVGFINNLTAAFWRAPVFGIRLTQKICRAREPSTFQSAFGRTSAIHEPHEFGYFWSRLLNQKDMCEPEPAQAAVIDWPLVRRVLINMTHAFGSALAFKSFLAVWHIERMWAELPRTCFVRIRREPLANAVSILKTRRQYLGDVTRWVSLMPTECRELTQSPPWVQVAAQVFYLEQGMSRRLAHLPAANVLELSYESLCESPRRAVRAVQKLLERHGPPVAWISDPPPQFEVPQSARNGEEYLPQLREEIERLYAAQPASDADAREKGRK